jgi:hypothetical protein
MELKLNEKKRNFMQFIGRHVTSFKPEAGSYNFEIVQEFKYF